jgi:hypothetical protein
MVDAARASVADFSKGVNIVSRRAPLCIGTHQQGLLPGATKRCIAGDHALLRDNASMQ